MCMNRGARLRCQDPRLNTVHLHRMTKNFVSGKRILRFTVQDITLHCTLQLEGLALIGRQERGVICSWFIRKSGERTDCSGRGCTGEDYCQICTCWCKAFVFKLQSSFKSRAEQRVCRQYFSVNHMWSLFYLRQIVLHGRHSTTT